MRIFDDNLPKIGFGYAIIEFNDGRLAEASIFNQSDDTQFRIFPNPPMACQDSTESLALIESIDFFQFQVTIADNDSKTPRISQKQKNDENIAIAVPDKSSSSNILNALNDECLQLIFEYLPIGDLCSVADTCKRFQTNAKEIFPVCVGGSMLKADNLFKFESLLRNFGTKIRSLSISGKETYWNENFRKNAVLVMLAKYCSSFKCQLRKLAIDNFNIQPIWYELLRPILMQLERLRLEQLKVCYLPDLCNQMTELDLMNVELDATSVVLIEVFGKMNKLGMAYIDNINELLDRMHPNPAVKTLKIWCARVKNDTLRKICAKFPALEQLDVQTDRCDDVVNISAEDMKMSFAQMKNLKRLKISQEILTSLYDGQCIFEILDDAGVQIEWLIISLISDVFRNNSLKSIQKLNQLKRLELICCKDAKALLSSAIHLPQLEEFRAHFDGNGTIILKGITAFEKMEMTNWRECVFFCFVDPNETDEYSFIRDYWIRDREGRLGIRINCSAPDLMRIVRRNLNGNPNLFEVLIFNE